MGEGMRDRVSRRGSLETAEKVLLYYLKKYVALLIRKTINAVTVMFAVMKIIQQIINAVTVIPVEMYQTISKHIMFRCHCRFLLQI